MKNEDHNSGVNSWLWFVWLQGPGNDWVKMPKMLFVWMRGLCAPPLRMWCGFSHSWDNLQLSVLKNDCRRSIIAVKIVQQMQPNLFDSTKCHVAKYSCNNYKINPASAITFPCINQYNWVHEHKTIPAEPNLKLTIITSQNYIEPLGCFQIFSIAIYLCFICDWEKKYSTMEIPVPDNRNFLWVING